MFTLKTVFLEINYLKAGLDIMRLESLDNLGVEILGSTRIYDDKV